MKVTVSSKYQIVIPKAVRRELGIKAGQKLEVHSDAKGNISVTKAESVEDFINKYAGSLKGAWGADPAATLRRMRDEEWD